MYLNRIPQPKSKGGRTRPALHASALQPVARDFAFVVGEDVPANKLVRAALVADKALVADVGVFDVFEGESLGAGQKSVALSVTLQPTERTLTDAEIDSVADKIIANVEKQTGGKLRG